MTTRHFTIPQYSAAITYFFAPILPLFFILMGLAIVFGPIDSPSCPTIEIWQVECAACGGTRAIRDLHLLRFAMAWKHNQLAVIGWIVLWLLFLLGIGALFSHRLRWCVNYLLSIVIRYPLAVIGIGILLGIIQWAVKLNKNFY